MLDLVPYSRLSASEPRPSPGAAWAREADDAVATVRDGHAATGYKPPPGRECWLEIDLQPWLGRPAALSFLELSCCGGGLDGARVELLAGAADGGDGADGATLPWADPATPLDLRGRSAGCVRLRFAARGELTITSLRLLGAAPDLDPDPEPALGRPAPPPAAAAGQPRGPHPDCGVIEGFYGRPWSWRERHRLLAALAAAGCGAYLYAPKDDAFHRARWREPYPPEEMRHFAELARDAAGLGVTFLLGLSPFIDLDPAQEADYRALEAKAAAFLALGAGGVALLADDIEYEAAIRVDGALAAAQVEVTHRLHATLAALRPGARCWFVPTVYSDRRLDRWPGSEEYLRRIGGLHPEIEILWTGPDTFAATMGAADLTRCCALVGRPPLIWDNYWANDTDDRHRGRLVMAPFAGRTPDLRDAVRGIAHNPAIQGAVARLLLGTFARWLEQPGTADREAVITHAVAAELRLARGAGRSPERDAASLRFLFAAFAAFGKGVPRFPALDRAVLALLARLPATAPPLPVEEAWALLLLLGRTTTVAAELHHGGLDPDLVDDLAAPLEKLRGEGEVGLAALALLGARLAGREGRTQALALEQALAASQACRHLHGTGQLEALAAAVLAQPPCDLGFVAPTPAGAPPAVAAGATASWSPFTAVAPDRLAVFGLPGAVADRGTVRWTPPHAGRYPGVAVALAQGQDGWAACHFAAACPGGAPDAPDPPGPPALLASAPMIQAAQKP